MLTDTFQPIPCHRPLFAHFTCDLILKKTTKNTGNKSIFYLAQEEGTLLCVPLRGRIVA